MTVYHEFISAVLSDALRETFRRSAGLRVSDVMVAAGVGSRSGYYKIKKGW